MKHGKQSDCFDNDPGRHLACLRSLARNKGGLQGNTKRPYLDYCFQKYELIKRNSCFRGFEFTFIESSYQRIGLRMVSFPDLIYLSMPCRQFFCFGNGVSYHFLSQRFSDLILDFLGELLLQVRRKIRYTAGTLARVRAWFDIIDDQLR